MHVWIWNAANANRLSFQTLYVVPFCIPFCLLFTLLCFCANATLQFKIDKNLRPTFTHGMYGLFVGFLCLGRRLYYFEYGLCQLGRFCVWFLWCLFKLSFWFCLFKIMSLFVPTDFTSIHNSSSHFRPCAVAFSIRLILWQTHILCLVMHLLFGNHSKLCERWKSVWFVLENEAIEINLYTFFPTFLSNFHVIIIWQSKFLLLITICIVCFEKNSNFPYSIKNKYELRNHLIRFDYGFDK